MSDVVVKVPAVLRAYVDDAREVRVAAGTVGEVLQRLATRHPQLLHRVLSPEGELRPFVNVFVDRDSVRGLQGLATPVPPGAVVSIVPAVAGG
jgi:molybdopterin converting factor small subunit